MIASLEISMLNLFSGTATADTSGAEPGAGMIKEFTMHHIQDQVLIPIQVLGFDISITKHVVMIWIAAAILILCLPLIARSKALIPHGPVNFLEWIIVFLKENVLAPYLGPDQFKYAPYLLTAFFFIVTCNLLGLVPAGATATGNIAVTAGMALITLFLVQFYSIQKNGFTGYLRVFIPPNLPFFVIPIIFMVEVVGMLTKHFALAIRLFANMFAGHLVIFTILGLIFLFKNLIISPFPIFMIIFLSLLEVLIALIQAYIFTILSTVFIGMAIHPEH
ncbi:F0F1 ATP synthase subunit A [candidate division KSB1 bacterium]|nr:F0F1 ATP synthase subunit A [candidate division KSB1 bacterium]